MFLGIATFDFIFAVLLVPILLAAVIVVGRLHTQRSQRKLRRGAKIVGVLVVVALVLVIGRVAGFIGLASYGWTFVSDRKLGTTVFMVIAAVALAVAALPALRAFKRIPAEDNQQPLTQEQRAAAYDPSVVVPVQAAAVAALPGLFEKFLPPYEQAVPTFLFTAAIVALLGWLLMVRAGRRYKRLSGDTYERRPLRIWAARLGVVVVLAGLVSTLFVLGARSSELPDTFSMMSGEPDFGGGEAFAHDGHAAHSAGTGRGVAPGGAVSVEEMKGPHDGVPDRKFTLTAQEKQVKFSSGATFDAWTFNGQVPGPELRMREGELVEVTLINNLRSAPVTVHWHGVDVPNGEDGVAGVTQDAVQPGQTYTYRFRADEVGTRWYHSHQQASEQVSRGLFGPLVIEPRQPQRPVDVDKSVVLHDFTADSKQISTVDAADTLERRQLAAGSKVRLRLVNSSNLTKQVTVTGVPYRVTAYDGTDVNDPGELTNARLIMAGAGRYDVEFTMPSSPVRIADVANPDAGIAYSPDGRGEVGADTSGAELDLLRYGKPVPTPFDWNSKFDRNFTLTFDVWLGFYNGAFALRQTINGRVFPDAPMHLVREGELIKMTFVNRGEEDHPIHLHGHHFLVLGLNGERPSGSPIWLDTVNVRPGEIVEIGFRADNPGIWMDHCHNFVHTQLGMVLHLAYENITSPYLVGGPAHNHPD